MQTGDLTLNTGAVLKTGVSGQSRNRPMLRVTGTITLANATLEIRLDGLPIQNHVLTIVENDGVDPVVGIRGPVRRDDGDD
jgi:hypothetical protein